MHSSVSHHRNLWVVLALAATQLALLGSVWPGFRSPNEYSRLYAAHALVARGTWSVNEEVRRYGRVEDLSRVGGRLFSNKAPGLIWAAVPVVAAVRIIAPSVSLEAELFAVRVVLVSAVSILAAAALAGWLRRRRSGAIEPAAAAFVLLFATPFAVYAGTAFAHAWTGSLLLLAAWLLFAVPEHRREAELAAGALMGLAVVSEYPAAVLAVVISAAGWRTRGAIVRMGLGAAPALAGLGAYNWACFGSPWTLASRLESVPRYARLAQDPTFGFGVPTPAGLFGLTFSPLVGLFFFAPVLLPALAAPVAVWRAGNRRLAIVLGGAAWLMPVLMAAYREWPGGAAFGPRYLVLAVPLMVLGFGCLPPGRRLEIWFSGGAVASALVTLAGRITPPFAIDAAASGATLRAWTVPAIAAGLWNPPLGVTSLGWVRTAIAAVVILWIATWAVAEGTATRDRSARRLAAAAVVAVALLAVQLGAGSVLPRQRAWFKAVSSSFRAGPPVSVPAIEPP